MEDLSPSAGGASRDARDTPVPGTRGTPVACGASQAARGIPSGRARGVQRGR